MFHLKTKSRVINYTSEITAEDSKRIILNFAQDSMRHTKVKKHSNVQIFFFDFIDRNRKLLSSLPRFKN